MTTLSGIIAYVDELLEAAEDELDDLAGEYADMLSSVPDQKRMDVVLDMPQTKRRLANCRRLAYVGIRSTLKTYPTREDALAGLKDALVESREAFKSYTDRLITSYKELPSYADREEGHVLDFRELVLALQVVLRELER